MPAADTRANASTAPGFHASASRGELPIKAIIALVPPHPAHGMPVAHFQTHPKNAKCTEWAESRMEANEAAEATKRRIRRSGRVRMRQGKGGGMDGTVEVTCPPLPGYQARHRPRSWLRRSSAHSKEVSAEERQRARELWKFHEPRTDPAP